MHTAALLLVGPNTLTRVGLERLLSDSPFTVVNVISDAALVRGEFDARAVPVPDIVLLECRDDVSGVLAALDRLRALYPDAPVVVLSNMVRLSILSACFAGGATGFLTTDISRAALLGSLQLAALGERVFPTELAGLLADGLVERRQLRPPEMNTGGLSDREIETVQCLLRGESNKLIAIRLRISEATIKVHMKSVMRKINVSNRTQAAIWAHSHGFLPWRDAVLAEGGDGRIGLR